MLKTRNNSLTD